MIHSSCWLLGDDFTIVAVLIQFFVPRPPNKAGLTGYTR